MTLNKSHNEKLDSLGYIFVTDSMGLTSTTLMQLVPKATKFGEITQNNGLYTIWSFKVTEYGTNKSLYATFYV